MHGASGGQDLAVLVALLHEVGLHLVAHHARVGVEVPTWRLDDDVGACGVDLLVVPEVSNMKRIDVTWKKYQRSQSGAR